MEKKGSVAISAYAFQFLVTLIIILSYLEFSESCHRRVEYVHYYKKQPHKGHGHHEGGYHGGGYGHQGGGHKGHGGGYHGGGHKGHGGGYHGGGGYGHQGGGHKGHGGGYHGGGHKGHGGGHHGGGYGHQGGGHKGHGGGYHGGGYGHEGGGHKGHGGGYHGGGHEGHGDGYHGGGYGHEGGGHKGHGGGYHGGGDDGHGGGYHGGGYGHEGGGHGGGYHGGGDEGHGGGYGHGGDHKGHSQSGQGGKKYKYQMYEVTHYKDPGYGKSGPYPNTEYSTPVETSVNAPLGPPNSFSDSISVLGDEDGRPLTQLDAFDTANLIRTNNVYDTKANELAHPRPSSGNFGGGHLSDSSISNSDYNSVDVLSTPTMKLSTASGNSRGESLTEMKVSPVAGNFDLNLNYNSDLPVPFRRNTFDSPTELGSGRRRKKISSKYRDGNNNHQQGTIFGLPSSVSEDADVSQSQQIPSGGPGPDYLENDTGDVGGSNVVTRIAEPPDFSTLNF